MKFQISGSVLTVIKESTDKKYYGTRNAAGESNFLYDLKKQLSSKGFDLVKKRMWKDGHLVDDMQQYLKTPKKSSKAPHIYLYGGFWTARGLNDDFNNGSVDISIEYDIYESQPNCKELMTQLIMS